MNKSSKFSPEVRERAVRMVQEHRGEYPSLWAAVESIAPKIPSHPKTRFSRSIPKPALESCRLYAGCRRDRKQVSSRLILGQAHGPSFDSTYRVNDASSVGLLALISPALTCHLYPVTFPQSLTTAPFERRSTGRFEACSCKPTSGGLLPSLVQLHELSLVFVTH